MKDLEYWISEMEDLLHGSLDSARSLEFKKAMDQDPYLKQEVLSELKARADIRNEGEALMKLRFQKKLESTPITKPAKRTSPLLWIILVAAIVGTILFLTPRMLDKSSPIVPLAELEQPNFDLMRSGDNSDMHIQWQEAVEQFNSKKYTEVINSLSKINDESFRQEHSGKFNLMLGISYLKNEAYPTAISSLKAINSSNPYYDQAEWYLALAHYYNSDEKSSQVLLQRIAQNSSHYRHKEAKEILSLK